MIDDRDGIAAAVYVEKFSQWRVTCCRGALLAAKHTVFLVAGEDKAEAVRAVFKEEYDPKKYPAQMPRITAAASPGFWTRPPPR